MSTPPIDRTGSSVPMPDENQNANRGAAHRTSASPEVVPSSRQGQVDSRLESLTRKPSRFAPGSHDAVQIDGVDWDVEFTCKQWTVATRPGPGDEDAVAAYRLVNLDNGRRQYYEVASGKYGEPIMRPEPERALDLPKNIAYVHCTSGEPITPNEKISGIILKDESGVTTGRFSLTNAAKQGINVKLSDDGRLTVDGKEYYLRALLAGDKNRIRNYDGFFSEVRPADGKVKMWEKEDLPL